jgi:glycosyltransferase involved in cell wall biosynthesis
VRILFLSDNFPPESNAPASRLHEHGRYWVRAGHEVTVITCAPNFPEGRIYPGYRNRWYQTEIVDGLRVVRVKTYIAANEGLVRRTFDYISFGLAAFVAGLFQRRPDVVIATSPQFFCALGGWALSFVRRLPFVFELRDLWPASIVAVGAIRRGAVIRILEWLELFLYRRASAIVCVSGAFRDNLVARGISRDKIRVVLNGADFSWCAPRPRDAGLESEFQLNGKFVVGYLGTHGLAHALDKVLDAAVLLCERPDIVFVFAGSGAERTRLEKRVTDERLTTVRLIPKQPKERVPALWTLCDLALIPLRDDPVFKTVIPSKLFEAMGNGVAVLLSIPEGEATGIVQHAGCGVSVPPERPAALAAAIIALAENPARLGELRSAATTAAQHYSREAMASEYIRSLSSLTSGTAAARGSRPARASRIEPR